MSEAIPASPERSGEPSQVGARDERGSGETRKSADDDDLVERGADDQGKQDRDHEHGGRAH